MFFFLFQKDKKESFLEVFNIEKENAKSVAAAPSIRLKPSSISCINHLGCPKKSLSRQLAVTDKLSSRWMKNGAERYHRGHRVLAAGWDQNSEIWLSVVHPEIHRGRRFGLYVLVQVTRWDQQAWWVPGVTVSIPCEHKRWQSSGGNGDACMLLKSSRSEDKRVNQAVSHTDQRVKANRSKPCVKGTLPASCFLSLWKDITTFHFCKRKANLH